MEKEIKVEVNLSYGKGKSDPSGGYFEEGVPDPDCLGELAVWVDEEERFDFDSDVFEKTGRLQVFFAGSRRSFFELGKYFIAMSKFPADNPDYHDHIDGLMDVTGEAAVELIVRLPTGPVE
jgi:hypothetical protein